VLTLCDFSCGGIHILGVSSWWYISQIMGSVLVAWPFASITSCHYTSHPFELTDVFLFTFTATLTISDTNVI
jgi:hypothetical protein